MRIQYRTPQQLGLLERFHADARRPRKCTGGCTIIRSTARECLAEFRARYNERRPHWALVPEEGGDVLVPVEVYRDWAERSRFRAGRPGPGRRRRSWTR